MAPTSHRPQPRAPPVSPTRARYRAARSFYLALVVLTCLATFALFTQHGARSDGTDVRGGLAPRDELVSPAQSADEECRLVHRAKDQCAFIKSHCGEDEPGFSAYLDLYFCRLAHVKAIAFVILVTWLCLLFSTIGIAASDFFCINLNTIAGILGMSESMAGVTFLAFGNGSPDVFSTFAAMSADSSSLAVGELFGAAGFITAVVAGSMALIKPFKVSRKSFVRDVSFFAVAAAFSMVFLWDGKLHLWECLAMVAFYVFYVLFVVVWHWWIGRRRARRETEAAARGQFIPPGDELDIEDEYRDDPDEAAESQRRPSTVRGVSREDWAALERGGGYSEDALADEEEEARDKWMSELSSNMRLTRPQARSRQGTLSNVRPSLVGALEFQAVLKSLQKSRNIQTIPLHARRYSDDPSFTSAQQQDRMSTLSDPVARPPLQVTIGGGGSPAFERQHLDVPHTAPPRARAVSANGADGLHINPDLDPVLSQRNLIDISDVETRPHTPSMHLNVPGRAQESQPQSPALHVSTASPRPESHLRPGSSGPAQLPNLLAPPPTQDGMLRPMDDSALQATRRTVADSPGVSPRTVSSARLSPNIVIPREQRSRGSSRSSSPFPPYRDDLSPMGSRPPSLLLPPSIASAESLPFSHNAEEELSTRPSLLVKYWPHKVLPLPGTLVSTLFPTIYRWQEKNWWEKSLGIVAAPSVLLLTITLPVVEDDKDKDDSDIEPVDLSFDSTRSKGINGAPGQNAAGLNGVSHENIRADVGPTTQHEHSLVSPNIGTGSAAVAAETEQHHHNFGDNAEHHAPIAVEQPPIVVSPAPLSEGEQPTPEPWNRWLAIVQLLLAPIFIVLAIYSQSPTDLSAKWLVKPILICLLVSLVLLIPLLLTTTPTHRPAAYRTIFSLVGFVVSIAWISTIAAQVVGALKALAVIMNMSHAIMGLTIFAVGNSLGDLVADVTVARLGYPVMALSACFGGPMLNILLGIGLSGSYIIIRGANSRHHKHPNKAVKFKSFHIDVSTTLFVSGAALLVTLIGLLIVVPLNRWTMSKKIGWALIMLWTLSTIGNVVLEWTGWADGTGES